ncbi:MAG: GTPase HflX [Chloroflexi bacterium]|nr:GTPase HflX [Chloroflexota bacterium]
MERGTGGEVGRRDTRPAARTATLASTPGDDRPATCREPPIPKTARKPSGRRARTHANPTVPRDERAILVAVDWAHAEHWDVDASLAELAMLAETAGATPVERVVQRLKHPDPHSYVGKGKLAAIAESRRDREASVVIFDDELTPAQQRALEAALDVKVIDRTALILDIFAQRARTTEGALQVALAQHEYLLPRLAGQWSHLERMEGAIGLRGPGETQLETDRRLIRAQIKTLKQRIERVRRHRREQRRRRAGMPVVALVGYTNAGKSTLLNGLTRAGVRTHDRLFETLDPTTRRWSIGAGGDPSGDGLGPAGAVLLTDTVGFIQKLPTQLIAAFRATLEELQEADVLLHVIDITHPDAAEQAQTVEETLADLGLLGRADAAPRITVLNKIDRLLPAAGGAGMDEAAALAALEPELRRALGADRGEEVVLVSAARRWGFAALRGAVGRGLGAGVEVAGGPSP